jgi:hypothetical protein
VLRKIEVTARALLARTGIRAAELERERLIGDYLAKLDDIRAKRSGLEPSGARAGGGR